MFKTFLKTEQLKTYIFPHIKCILNIRNDYGVKCSCWWFFWYLSFEQFNFNPV